MIFWENGKAQIGLSLPHRHRILVENKLWEKFNSVALEILKRHLSYDKPNAWLWFVWEVGEAKILFFVNSLSPLLCILSLLWVQNPSQNKYFINCSILKVQCPISNVFLSNCLIFSLSQILTSIFICLSNLVCFWVKLMNVNLRVPFEH